MVPTGRGDEGRAVLRHSWCGLGTTARKEVEETKRRPRIDYGEQPQPMPRHPRRLGELKRAIRMRCYGDGFRRRGELCVAGAGARGIEEAAHQVRMISWGIRFSLSKTVTCGAVYGIMHDRSNRQVPNTTQTHASKAGGGEAGRHLCIFRPPGTMVYRPRDPG